ncbi:MAG: DUF2207 domain-containing protein [Eubacterium sp.]|nr:DUF2207 domain-containing protein [Eubacterium sp.]
MENDTNIKQNQIQQNQAQQSQAQQSQAQQSQAQQNQTQQNRIRQNQTKRSRRIVMIVVILIIALLIAMLLTVRPAFTAVNYNDSDPLDYITERFDVQVEATEKHVLRVREEIDVDFRQPHHGIERYIPYSSKLYTIKHIKVKGGKAAKDTTWDFVDDYQVGDVGLRIGDEDKVLTGAQHYEISYDLICNEDDDKSADYLSIDLLPTGWGTSIREADLTLTLPKEIDPAVLKVYAGQYGDEAIAGSAADGAQVGENTGADSSQQGSASGAQAWTLEGGTEFHMHVTDSPKGSGVTLQAELPDGYWVGARNNTPALYLLLICLIGCPLAAAVMWFLFGRDPEIVQTVEFEPPDGLTPAELGYVIDGRVDKGDMSSMLMYYAARGYLGIYEKKKKEYELRELKKPEPDDEKQFARTLFSGIFSGKKRRNVDGMEIRTASLNKLPADYGKKLATAEFQLQGEYTGDKALHTEASKTCRVISVLLVLGNLIFVTLLASAFSFRNGIRWNLIFLLPLAAAGAWLAIHSFDVRRSRGRVKTLLFGGLGWILYAAAFIISGRTLGYVTERVNVTGSSPLAGIAGSHMTLTLLLAFSMGLTLFFAIIMRARTKSGAALVGKILGFRNFIQTAEIDRLRVLQDSDPNYFFRIMPYAYAMGLGARWAKKFTDIKVEQPPWYSTYDGGIWVFSPLWYHNFTQTTTRSYAGSFVNNPDSGSHGSFGGGGGSFSGGGFSGGGFGGGGGGAW